MTDYIEKALSGRSTFHKKKKMSTHDVARIFNVHTSTIRRWSQRGILKPCEIDANGARRFKCEDVAVLYLDRAIRRYLRELRGQ